MIFRAVILLIMCVAQAGAVASESRFRLFIQEISCQPSASNTLNCSFSYQLNKGVEKHNSDIYFEGVRIFSYRPSQDSYFFKTYSEKELQKAGLYQRKIISGEFYKFLWIIDRDDKQTSPKENTLFCIEVLGRGPWSKVPLGIESFYYSGSDVVLAHEALKGSGDITCIKDKPFLIENGT